MSKIATRSNTGPDLPSSCSFPPLCSPLTQRKQSRCFAMHIIESQNSLELERKHQQAELNIDPKCSLLSTLDLHVFLHLATWSF